MCCVCVGRTRRWPGEATPQQADLCRCVCVLASTNKPPKCHLRALSGKLTTIRTYRHTHTHTHTHTPAGKLTREYARTHTHISETSMVGVYMRDHTRRRTRTDTPIYAHTHTDVWPCNFGFGNHLQHKQTQTRAPTHTHPACVVCGVFLHALCEVQPNKVQGHAHRVRE